MNKKDKLKLLNENFILHNIYSIDDIKKISEQRGSHWFSKDTMSFFRSKVYQNIFPGKNLIFFISSEKFNEQSPRLFSVRSFNPVRGGKNDGEIATVGNFQQYATKAQAETAALNLALEN